MVYIIRNWNKGVSKIKSEIIILVFGVAVAMSVGFVFSSSIRSGKPNIEPSAFFPSFTVVLLLYLIARLGVGILTAVRKKRKG